MSLIASGVMAYILACVAANVIPKLIAHGGAIMASWRDPVKPRWNQAEEAPDKNYLAGNVSKLHASHFETPSPVRRPQPKVSDKAIYYPALYRDPDARPARRDEDNGFGSYEQN